MNARFTPVIPRSSRDARSAGLACAFGLLALALLAASGRAAAEEPVTAVWKARELGFTYLGYEAVYPCRVLQQRIALMLNAVGARPDLEVIVTDCDQAFATSTVPVGDGPGWPPATAGPAPGGSPTLDAGWTRMPPTPGRRSARRTEPRQTANVRVRMAMPVAVTAEVLAELEADRKRRELITEVTGNPLPLFDNPIPFAAQRRVVTLSEETAGVQPADCELLDQMATSVFRDLGVRVLRRGYTCDRSWESRIAPTLDVEALVPAALEIGGPEPPAEDEDPADAFEAGSEAEAQATAEVPGPE